MRLGLNFWATAIVIFSLSLHSIGSSIEKKELREAYEQQLQEQASKYEQLQKQIKARRDAHSLLDANAAALRVQLSPNNTSSASSDRQDFATELLSRRVEALETALREATTLIKERDKCALDYNALKAQCTGGANGR